MPLQPSDIPALRAKHLDLVQARYHHLVEVRNYWSGLALGVLMVTGVLTLLIAIVVVPPTVSVGLTILFIFAMEWVFIDMVKERDWRYFSMILGAAETFGHSTSAGFDTVPDFTKAFGNWYASGPIERDWEQDGAPNFFKKLWWYALIKTLVALILLPFNQLRMLWWV